jgi:hypothetical protein
MAIDGGGHVVVTGTSATATGLDWTTIRYRAVDPGLPPDAGTTTAIGDPRATPESPRLTVSPNPVASVARFEIEGAAPAALEIYDPSGRLVELVGAGEALEWRPGAAASSGVYFARLRGSGGGTATVKFLVIE